MKTTIKIGRDNANDVIINEPGVSRSHAIIQHLGEDSYELKDLQSSNGTFVNDERVTKAVIRAGDRVKVANSRVDWLGAFSTSQSTGKDDPINEDPHAAIRKTITIGTAPENDIILASSFVSSSHAKLSVLKNREYFLEDLGSSNGSFINNYRIEAKNFLLTDIVKLADAELPKDWFRHPNLRFGFVSDHKKGLAWTLSVLLLITAGALLYTNRCRWLNRDCDCTSREIYAANKSALVRIEHAYYYDLTYSGQHYFVGKNKYFTSQAEANTSTDNLLPYNSISGNGCFVRKDGTILTAPSVTHPWLNHNEQTEMLQAVIKSRTVHGLNSKTISMVSGICGKTAGLKWIANGQVANAENYVQAISKSPCMANDSEAGLIHSVKASLPVGATIVNVVPMQNNGKPIVDTGLKYLGGFVSIGADEALRDTIYAVSGIAQSDGMTVSQQTVPQQFLEAGSPIFNTRGELIGLVENTHILSVHRFIHQPHH